MRRLVLAVLVALTAAPASAYEIKRSSTGEPIVWSRLAFPLPYAIQADGSQDVTDGSDVDAVAVGFQAWADPSCSAVRWYRGPDLSEPVVAPSCGSATRNVVWWEESTWPADLGPAVLAVTTTCYDIGYVSRAFMAFNGVDHTWATDGRADAFDIQSVATHEAGHWLGLGHSDVPEATMWPYTGPGEIGERSLASDDVQGICALYPVGGTGDACTSDARCISGMNDFGAVCETAWEGGYCTIPCGDGVSCERGAWCAPPPGEDAPICLIRCSKDVEAEQCRPGYACHTLHEGVSVCAPPCATDADCGAGKVCGEDGACGPAPAVDGGAGGGGDVAPGGCACGATAPGGFSGGAVLLLGLLLYLRSPMKRRR